MARLAAETTTTNGGDDFGFWGVIKETGVDDEGLTEFHKNYYDFPLYRDVGLVAYASLGNKSIWDDLSWNPFRIYRGYKTLSKRLKEKNLDGNMEGEGITKGGVFILNADGEVMYAVAEVTGDPLDMDEIKNAMDAIRKGTADAVKQEL